MCSTCAHKKSTAKSMQHNICNIKYAAINFQHKYDAKTIQHQVSRKNCTVQDVPDKMCTMNLKHLNFVLRCQGFGRTQWWENEKIPWKLLWKYCTWLWHHGGGSGDILPLCEVDGLGVQGSGGVGVLREVVGLADFKDSGIMDWRASWVVL